MEDDNDEKFLNKTRKILESEIENIKKNLKTLENKSNLEKNDEQKSIRLNSKKENL